MNALSNQGSERRMALSVVIPIYNEEATLPGTQKATNRHDHHRSSRA